MDNKLNIFSLWSIDDIADTQTIKKQMDDFIHLGFNGVVFHPRRYSSEIKYLSKEYMDILSDIILYAKEIGLDFWLYDENGWPSGSADGQVIEAIPDLKCKWLEYEDGRAVIKERTGINSIDKSGVKRFIEITHEGYKQGLGKEAFDYVGGFFSDEVGFLEGHGACMDSGGIPWSDEIADKYDGDIFERLSELFNEAESEFKIWYWETLTALLAENFYGTIEKWCSDNGKLYTAHLKGEESPFFQLSYSGSAFQVLKNVSVPGVDALGRDIGNKFYPRIVSSLAKQFGNGIAMAEAMGGAGWGLLPQDVADYTEWLIKSGINMIIFHINQLHLTYDSITDWPSSIPCHQPWRDVFPMLICNMRKLAENKKECDTLLICPTRGVMNTFAPRLVQGMNEHDGSHQMICKSSKISREIVEVSERLYNDGIEFDVTDEKVFEDYAAAENGTIKLGNCTYKKVIPMDGCIFGDKGKQLLAGVASNSLKQTEWIITPPKANRYFIEIKGGMGTLKSKYLCDCALLVSDRCDKITVNDIPLMLIKNDEYGYYYLLPSELMKTGENTIKLYDIENAFVYAIGDFAVKNEYPFYEYDERQLCTRNGFYIAPSGKADTDFIMSGYPFAAEPIICEKEIIKRTDGYIRVDCSHIAAAKVYVNGKETGWIYGENDKIKIEAGDTKIKLEVYQSAFNLYGPHHHLEGNRHLVSPMQYTGEKNFADTPSLPDYTLQEEMKFVKWQIPQNIEEA